MKKYFMISGLVLAAACGPKKEPPAANTQQANMTMPERDTAKFAFAPDVVDNIKDPICRMPVKMGISDTIHYMKKVYGFCSVGCKEEFVKAPKAYMEDAKLK